MKHIPSILTIGLLGVFLAGLLPFPAYAAEGCSKDGINTIFCSIVLQFGVFPKFLATISYVMAAIFGLLGLLQLKEYGEDPSKTPLRSILMKFFLSAVLVSLPLAMRVFVTTVTGADSLESETTIRQPSFGKGVSGK